MSAKKFKFVSPGVFLSEIDNSQLPKVPGGVGPVIIGRTRRGPAMKPVKVSSFQEFVEVFGEPLPGNEGEDPWREGNGLLAPSYAPLAAQAYLKADINSPVTVIRLAGVQGDDVQSGAEAGWDVEDAYGLFVAVSGTAAAQNATLCAIAYTDNASFEFGVKGTATVNSEIITSRAKAAGAETKAVKIVDHAFDISVSNGSKTAIKKVSFREGKNQIRDILNTNPVATNSSIIQPPSASLGEYYWLGETFEEEYEKIVRENPSSTLCVFAAKLTDGMENFKSVKHQLAAARSGWVIPQYNGAAASYNVEDLEKLFRFIAIQEGEQGMDINVRIENIKIANPGSPSLFGRFDVVVEQKRGNRIYIVDSYENLNLNPNSNDFIARRIGDQYFEWDGVQKRNKVYGNYPNQSSYVRVEMANEVGENGPSDPKSVPFGYLGPIVPKPTSISATSGTGSFAGGASWVKNIIAFDLAQTSIVLNWPTVPHVVSGSKSPSLNSKYVMGSAEYNMKTSTAHSAGILNYSSPNKGSRDYLRRLGTWNSSAVLDEQISGIASTGKHSYNFSLDEVYITGTTNLSNDMSSFKPTEVVFLSGSHRAVKATATILFVAAPDPGRLITIVSSDGTSLVYTAHGSEVLAERKFNRADTATAAATSLAACIAHSAGHGPSRITVERDTATLTLTQVIGGDIGNKAITSNLTDVKINGGAAAASGFFTDGGRMAFTSQLEASRVASGVPTQLSSSALLEIVDSFSMPMHGGFDGVNVQEADPFNMSVRSNCVGPDSTTRNSYAHASIDRAIELIKDPEALEMNLAVMPGITNTSLTKKLVQTCESRADSLAIIDLPDVYIPPSQKRCANFQDRVNNTTPAKSAKALIARQLNSSYGAAYYPWVKVRDSINARDVWAPPSVVALGVMGYTEQRDEVWFAPAGFNRGGLNEGNAGLPVLQASEQLLSADRDTLYEANINPIASFVSEGLVVFGQKTLQMTPSALDRINVRRLLIFVKKEVSRIANGLLFDQNVPATWARFTGQVVPFLEGVKTRLGLTDFKVVLDKTTTTPDLVDRNVMYAKIFLKPARAIEFIAVDFVITRSGASFDD
jgi:phage tail sheath protein FI